MEYQDKANFEEYSHEWSLIYLAFESMEAKGIIENDKTIMATDTSVECQSATIEYLKMAMAKET